MLRRDVWMWVLVLISVVLPSGVPVWVRWATVVPIWAYAVWQLWRAWQAYKGMRRAKRELEEMVNAHLSDLAEGRISPGWEYPGEAINNHQGQNRGTETQSQ